MAANKMNAVIENVMETSIEEAVRATVRSLWKDKTHDETDEFVHELLMALGLRVGVLLGGIKLPVRRTVEAQQQQSGGNSDDSDDDYSLIPALAKAEDVAPAAGAADEAKDSRKRTVSKKMKDTFLAMEGGTEESLKAAMKVYKSADQAQIDAWGSKWDAFARAFLAGECAPAKKATTTPTKKAPKAAAAAPGAPKKEARNFTWTPTAKKLFTEAVEGGGGAVSDLLKDQFATHVNAMTAEDYKVLAPVGHMRAFVASKSPVPAAAPAAAEDDDDDEEEDLEELDFEGEKLSIGVKSGNIYRQTENSGDVKIGVAGAGKFAGVKIPSA
jgi:hypothetical protein